MHVEKCSNVLIPSEDIGRIQVWTQTFYEVYSHKILQAKSVLSSFTILLRSEISMLPDAFICHLQCALYSAIPYRRTLGCTLELESTSLPFGHFIFQDPGMTLCPKHLEHLVCWHEQVPDECDNTQKRV